MELGLDHHMSQWGISGILFWNWLSVLLHSQRQAINSLRPSDSKCVGDLTSISSDIGVSPALSTPSYYLNQCWDIVNWTPWNFIWNSKIFIQKYALIMSAATWRPFCLGHNVLSYWKIVRHVDINLVLWIGSSHTRTQTIVHLLGLVLTFLQNSCLFSC